MIDVEIEADAWTAALPDAERLARNAAEAVLLPPSPSWAGWPERSEGRVGGGTVLNGGSPPPWPASSTCPSPQGGGRDVVILLTEDAAIRELNRDHRGKDAPTNVLSFPAAPSAAPHLGDVALAFETCAREADAGGKPLADHLQHLVAHGVLHLLGWDHQTEAEAEAMEAHERAVLAALGKPDPYRDRDIPTHG